MKKQIIQLTLLSILFLLPITNFAQIVSFSYDESGNIIQRDIIYIENKNSTDTTALQYDAIINKISVSIFPNPNGGKFNVNINNAEENTKASLSIYNMSGILIIKKESLKELTNVDISKYKNGTYLLSIIINGKKETWKVLKR